jgi:hypothetical protein
MNKMYNSTFITAIIAFVLSVPLALVVAERATALSENEEKLNCSYQILSNKILPGKNNGRKSSKIQEGGQDHKNVICNCAGFEILGRDQEKIYHSN